MKRVTMADVAKKANVSKSTVSQYVNNRYEYMSKDTRNRIKEVIDELGYQVNIVARSLTQKRTSTIGVIVANILHTFSTQIIRVIEDYYNKLDVHVIVCNADDKPSKEKKYIEMLLAKQVDGLIVFPTGGNISIYKKLIGQNYPLVFMDRRMKDVGAATVLLNNEHAADLAVNHLMLNGHKRIAIITTSISRNITPRIERINGYKKSIVKNGEVIDESYIVSQDIEKLSKSIKKLLSLKKRPSAIFAANDLAMMEVLRFVKENNIKIPEQLSLISVDDIQFANIYTPRLTTIAQPTYEMGNKAATLLLAKIEKVGSERDDIKIHTFKGRLMARESVAELTS